METQQAFTPTVLSESGPIKNYNVVIRSVHVSQYPPDSFGSSSNATLLLIGNEPSLYRYCLVNLGIENNPPSSEPIQIDTTTAVVGINENAYDGKNSINIPSEFSIVVDLDFNPELGSNFEIQLSAPSSEFNSVSSSWENSDTN